MRVTIRELLAKKGSSPIVVATAYDAWMAGIVDEAVDMILIGDSLGMVVQGQESTIPVTLDEMIYHTRMVVRGSKKAFILADLPFLSYQSSVRDAVIAAGRLLKEGYAQGVKLEGGKRVVPQVEAMVAAGIPVLGHLGLTPQSIHAFGSYGKRAKNQEAANLLVEDALALEQAGVSMIVLENIPHALAARVSKVLAIPTIGIGAGADCDGQVQVFHDLFGFSDFAPRHAVRYLDCGQEMKQAMQKFAAAVRSRDFISK
ncbi:MAG: 3-methyl-2-oxobutanoate hydroxymethyltransferase [SAR324 cluster bacterium]|uniref:3-methyl-2-oxobutanoate hydroxymethyltransferase n=1 Tax=SAR324 cluster bacterium TaxID=2024889 RepID=A0A2A4T729_9DELT|nr:MAG: 3-methyl-2-oxobutanoate hydroxymethyltransferase [SAR324 cluster bacterium]